MRYVKERSDLEIAFMNSPRPVRDAAEEIYDTFELRDLKKIVKGIPDRKFDRIVDRLSQEDVDTALYIALNWAIEDTTGVFPESKNKEEIEESTEEETETLEEREIDWTDYKIPTWALPALINGDYSGLTDEEEDMLIRFEKQVIRDAGKPGHWGVDDDEPYFSRNNDINRGGGDVVDAKYYVMESKEKKNLKVGNVILEKGDKIQILSEYTEEEPNFGDFVIIRKVSDSGVIDDNKIGDEIQGTVDFVDNTSKGLRLKLNIKMHGKPNYGVFYIPENYRIVYINGERYEGKYD